MRHLIFRIHVLLQKVNDSKMAGFCFDTVQKLFARNGMLFSRKFFSENADRVERVLSMLEDDESKSVYRAMIKYRCCRKRRYINPHMRPKKTIYLDQKLVKPLEDEVFVDCGAFAGESSLAFQQFCISAGKPAPLCVLFEPEPANFTLLKQQLPKFECKPVLFQTGLWREPGRLAFAAGLYSSSRVADAGKSGIRVDTLDRLLDGIPGLPPVTYIKIDVEGSDSDVIRGARHIIQTYRPRIAAAIYHSNEHMLEMPELLREICPTYRFYVRHYSCFEAETVLYCI